MILCRITIEPRNSAAMIAFVNVLLERSPRDLKLGYFTVLTIIAERNTSTIGKRYEALPSVRSFSLSWIIRSVSEATRPAAEGIGKPRKSFCPGRLGCALRQLKRASRNA